MLEKVKRCEFTTPRQIKRQVPQALEAIYLKAMARAQSSRYTTALELAADSIWLAPPEKSAVLPMRSFKPCLIRSRCSWHSISLLRRSE